MNSKRIVSILGARPQFIKHCPTNKALKELGFEDIILHTGQHYDRDMSDTFFDELNIPKPNFNLGIGSGSQAKQTAAMLKGMDEILNDLKPDMILVHGDTNSTLSGALTAVKLGIPVAHNEAGMRSFNRSMPEEINRVLTDHCSSLLFCPNRSSADQLRKEGIISGVHIIGDVQYDLTLASSSVAKASSNILAKNNLSKGNYILATMHRPYTVDDPVRLKAVFSTFSKVQSKIVFPLHPRTRKRLKEFLISTPLNVILIDPVGYLDMTALEMSARMILTDSGGIQKEAYFHGVPCLTLRPETEWKETVTAGWNRVVDIDEKAIIESTQTQWWSDNRPNIFGDGHAAQKLANAILEYFKLTQDQIP